VGTARWPPADRREAEILALAWRELEHVSAERLLSGSGLPLLHRLVAEVDGRRCEPWSTAEIVARAVSGERPAVPRRDRHLLRAARLEWQEILR
jgi:glucokinase